MPLSVRPRVSDGSVSPTATLVDVQQPILLASTRDGHQSNTALLLAQVTNRRLVVPPANSPMYTTTLPAWQITLPPSTVTKVVMLVSSVSMVPLGPRATWTTPSVRPVARS